VFLAAVAALLVSAPAAHTSGTPFLAGFADALPEQNPNAGPAAVALGASAIRLTLQWTPGREALSTPELVALRRGTSSSSPLRVLLSVYGTSSASPLDDSSRAQYCAYVSDALRRVPTLRDVVIWNEPNKVQFWSPQSGAPAAYESLLATCYDVLHAAFPGVNVLGFALSHDGKDDDSSTSPGAFIRGAGDAYRASGRTTPIFDTVAFHPYPLTDTERPWAKHVDSSTIAEGDWNKLMYNLWLAFHDTGQAIPGDRGVTIWYTEIGFQSAAPPEKSGIYSGAENITALAEATAGDTSPHPAESSPAPDQASQVRDAFALAACQPYVGAMLNFLAVDEPELTAWQSGALYSDLTRKSSTPAFVDAFTAAAHGQVDCNALKGEIPSSDFIPPTTPTGLAATATVGGHAVTLTWKPATDAQSSLTYRIYRNGTQVGEAKKPLFIDSKVMARRSYAYTVRAIDAASNLGAESTALQVTPGDTASASGRTAIAGPSAGSIKKPLTPRRVHVVFGTARRDRLVGTRNADLLRGLSGNDVLTGLGGHDTLLGGAGYDTLHARDGLRDVVDCGPGKDVAYVDRRDAVAKNCETVRR
jgi:hypothetical protein